MSTFIPVGFSCQCPQGLYLSQSSCVPCRATCQSCDVSAHNCSVCVEKAVLDSGTCICPPGYEETTYGCNPLGPFNVTLSVRSPSTLQLRFSHPLQGALNSEKMELVINGYHYKFTLIQVDNSTYLLNITWTGDPPDLDTMAQVIFQDPASILDTTGAPLGTNYTQGNLIYDRPSDWVIQSDSVKRSGKFFATSFSCLAVLIGAANSDLAVALSTVSVFQILGILPMMQLNFTTVASSFLVSLQNYKILPNWVNRDYGIGSSTNPGNSEDVNFGSPVFLQNVSALVTWLLVVVGVLPFVALGAYLGTGDFGRICKLVLQAYRVRIPFACWLVVYLEFGLSAFVQLHSISLETAYLTFNSSLAVLTLVAMGISPFLLSGFLLYNTKTFSSPSNLRKIDLWRPLFSEFTYEKGVSRLFFYSFFFLRRWIYLLILLFASDIPEFQVYFSLITSLIMLSYLGVIRPFRNWTSQIANMISETGISLSFLISSLYIQPSVSTTSLDICLVLTVCLTVGVQVLVSIYSLVQTVRAIVEIDSNHVERMEVQGKPPPETDMSLESVPDETHLGK